MLKSTILLLSALLASSSVSAKLNVVLPDSDSTWYANETGMIQWTSTATEFGVLCDIQLIDTKTQEVALNVTKDSIPCSLDSYNTSVLPSFKHSKFLVRVGEIHNASTWSYTENFKIQPARKQTKMTSSSHHQNQTMIHDAKNQTMSNSTKSN